MNDANAPSGEFRLSELEDRLKAFFADGKEAPIGYICCENIGQPHGRAQMPA